jgi:uncharacterized protein (DUF983 family)
MYCSSCGVIVAQGLSYCNYCGARLSGAKDDDLTKTPQVKPEFLVSAMVGVFIVGLVAITMLMGMMKAILHADLGLILAFALLCFLIMLSLEGVFLRLLFRRRRGTDEASDNVHLKGNATKELDSAHTRAMPEPVPSVTEHTTRAFDPIYTERTSK